MPGSNDSGPRPFPATRLSLIEALGATDPEARRPAYDALIRVYWAPSVRYLEIVRRFSRQDAEDLTQDFFARAFDRQTLATFDPTLGRFRTFLRVCLDRFAANAVKGRERLKRGGGTTSVPIDDEAVGVAAAIDPETWFRREWIRALFEAALERVTTDYRERGKETELAIFLAYDIDPAEPDRRPRYQDVAERFQVPVTQVTNYLAAARRSFRRAVWEGLRSVTATDEDLAAEARELLGIEPS